MTDILEKIVAEERHALWIKNNALELARDNIAQDERRPNEAMNNTMTILLMFRTGCDMDSARQAIKDAADEIEKQRGEVELRLDQEWLGETKEG